jgi:hypothetical protein
MEGRNMSLVLAPDKKAQDALRKAAEAERRMATATQPDENSEANQPNEAIGAASAEPAGASVISEPATPPEGEPVGEPLQTSGDQ